MYYGWRVVAATGLIYSLILGCTYSGFGLFVIPVGDELNLSRADMNTALILLSIGSAIVAPLVGRMLDRVSARSVMAVAAVLAGLSFTILSISTSLWLSALVLLIMLPIVLQGAGTLTITVLLARWFSVRRARAMLLAAMGASLGGVLVVPAIGWLLEREGWRTTLLVMGGTMMVVLLLIAFFIRERPAPGELEGSVSDMPLVGAEGSAAEPAAPAKVSTLLKMPKFWTIGISASLAMAIIQAIMITIVPLAVTSGMTTLQAAGLISVSGGAAIATKILLAIVADRFDRIYLLSGLFTLGILVNLLLLIGSGQTMLLVCAIILGIASSAIAPAFYALLADSFELVSFGTVRGLMATLIAVMNALGLRIAGEIFDRFGEYNNLFILFMGLGGIAVIVMWMTQRLQPMETA